MTYPSWPPHQSWPPQPTPPAPPTGYGFGPAGRPFAPPPFVPPPYGQPKRSRGALWVTLSVFGALLAVVAGLAVVFIGVGPSDEDQITSAITGFGQAVDSGDWKTATTYLCAAEAEQFADGNDAGPDDPTAKPSSRLPINVSDIQISGDAATAELSRPPQPSRTLHLVKEAGAWKLCNQETP